MDQLNFLAVHQIGRGSIVQFPAQCRASPQTPQYLLIKRRELDDYLVEPSEKTPLGFADDTVPAIEGSPINQ